MSTEYASSILVPTDQWARLGASGYPQYNSYNTAMNVYNQQNYGPVVASTAAVYNAFTNGGKI